MNLQKQFHHHCYLNYQVKFQYLFVSNCVAIFLFTYVELFIINIYIGCTENDTITDKNDKTYDDESEYSSIRDDSQSQSQQILNISCQNQSQDVSNLSVQSDTNRSQNNNIAEIINAIPGGAPDDDQMFVVHFNQEIRKKNIFVFIVKHFKQS